MPCSRLFAKRPYAGFTRLGMLLTLAVATGLTVTMYEFFAHKRAVILLATCQSNLKGVALATLQYSQDYDNRLPLISSPGDGTYSYDTYRVYGWTDALQPYTGEEAYPYCPSDPYAIDPYSGSGIPSPRTPGRTSYYYNGNLNERSKQRSYRKRGASPRITTPITGLSLTQMSDPGLTLLFGEGSAGDARYHRTSTEHQARGAWPSTDVPDVRHLGEGSYAFCDGHVSALEPSRISNGATVTAISPRHLGSFSATFAPY